MGSNQLTSNTDNTKIFVWENRYDKATYTKNNGTYSDITYPKGTLMGRISSTRKIVPLTSGASDGSQYPVGVLAEDIVVEAGDTFDKDVNFCVSGDVNEASVLFQGSDSFDTVVSGRTLRDRIGADTVGIKLVKADELTGYDNQ